MKRLFFAFILIALVVIFTTYFSNIITQSCQSIPRNKAGTLYSVSLIKGKKTKLLKPSFFGFNLEWVGFQNSFWDEKTKTINPLLIKWMQVFPGAVYRYPGGTVANYFDWKRATGDVRYRKQQKAVSWYGLLTTRFGVDEYLSFVKQVSGESWIVANLYGRYGQEMPLLTLAKEAAGFAEYISNRTRQSGLSSVLRWELGNELDRDIYQWLPDKYSVRAGQVADAIKSVIPDAKFVALAEDYDAQAKTSGLTASKYNNQIVSSLGGKVNEYANHLYYDGKPGGPPIPNRLEQVCNTLNSIHTNLPDSNVATAGIWITEHAQSPEGKSIDQDWESKWWKTTSLQGGLSVADLIIATIQIPEVKGAFLHALEGTVGPWPLFHSDSHDSFHPSVIYWTLRILREAMLDEVIITQTTSANLSNYAGGYDVRAAVLASKDRKQYAIWAINRNDTAIKLDVQIPLCKECNAKFTKTELTNKSPDATNSILANSVLPRKSIGSLLMNSPGRTTVSLSPYSITTFIVTIPERTQ